MSAKTKGKVRGPVVLVTGASQGIGAAIAYVFAEEVPGVRLALIARNERNLRAVAQRCERTGATVEIFSCDVSDETAVSEMAEAVKKKFGVVDVLINNAGKFTGAPFASMAVSQFDDLIAANLRSAFLVTRAFVPAMIKRRRGDVFFMSSIAGKQAYPDGAGYCAAKFGVSALAKVLRAETAAAGVRVCCVYPGATWSPSWAKSGIKEERIMPTADVARAFFDLYRLSRGTVVEEIILRPQLGDV